MLYNPVALLVALTYLSISSKVQLSCSFAILTLSGGPILTCRGWVKEPSRLRFRQFSGYIFLILILIFVINILQALTGNEYPYVQFGKPTKATYEFAEHALKAQIQELYGSIKILPNMYAPFQMLRYLYTDCSL